jgi:hypothetical protein
MTFPGRSTTIVVEPLERPQEEPGPEPRRADAPAPPPPRDPEPART